MIEAERERTTAQRQVEDLNRQREAITTYLDELRSLLTAPAYLARMKAGYAELREKLGQHQAAKKTAELMVGYLRGSR